jgi:hypothetical protein
MLSAGRQSSRTNFYICRIFFSSFTSDSVLFFSVYAFSDRRLVTGYPSFLPSYWNWLLLLISLRGLLKKSGSATRTYILTLFTYIYIPPNGGHESRKVSTKRACMHACMEYGREDYMPYIHRRAKKKNHSKSIPNPNISPFSIHSHMHPFDGWNKVKQKLHTSILSCTRSTWSKKRWIQIAAKLLQKLFLTLNII